MKCYRLNFKYTTAAEQHRTEKCIRFVLVSAGFNPRDILQLHESTSNSEYFYSGASTP